MYFLGESTIQPTTTSINWDQKYMDSLGSKKKNQWMSEVIESHVLEHRMVRGEGRNFEAEFVNDLAGWN